MEGGPADSRRRPAGAPGQTRHAYDGRRSDRRLGFDLDFAVVATLQRLRVDRDDRDLALRCDRFYRRLREDGEAAESRSHWPAEVARTVTDCSGSLGRALHGDEVDRRDRLFVEPEHPIFEMDGGSEQEFCRSLYIPGLDC